MARDEYDDLSGDYDVGADAAPAGDSFRPLTRAERDALAILLNPAYFDASSIQKANAAGVSYTHWCKLMRDPFFKQVQLHIVTNVIGERMMPLIEASMRVALQDGARGYADRRMLLEMLGVPVGDAYGRGGGRGKGDGVGDAGGSGTAIKAYEDIDMGVIPSRRMPVDAGSNGNGNGNGNGSH